MDATDLLGIPFLEALDPPAIHTITHAMADAIEANLIVGAGRRTGVQSIANSSTTKVQMQAELMDTDAMVDIAGNNTRITVKTAGLYQISASAILDGTGSVEPLMLSRNNTPEAFGTNSAPAVVASTALTLFYVTVAAVNDYFELSARHALGSAKDLTLASFAVVRLSPT